ncbi:enoyl-CoA hydratase [Mycobacterium tuberculosis CAS/NITR204]|uniref:Enoyl-CoA hydratase n=1 Tax=Mycobacterium tuberculosis CAS/NITR204 TaxID=1310114 RepID=R4MBK2_MYCTX|nr:enoyl-CoA hydratase [Mycobacterium tuberculosis CAS/NITR204]
MDSPVDYAGPAACGGPFARLTLNSPHNRNALSSTLVSQLHQGLSAAEADPAVRLVVLGHTGGTFCAGADLSEAGGGGGDGRMVVARAREMTALLRAIVESPLPVVGAINGHVRAGGFGLVGACDMVVAGPESTFALTEARIGVAPAIISLFALREFAARRVAQVPDRREVRRPRSRRHRTDHHGAEWRPRCPPVRRGPRGVQVPGRTKALTTGVARRVRPRRRTPDRGVGQAVRLRRSARRDAGLPAESAPLGQPATMRAAD